MSWKDLAVSIVSKSAHKFIFGCEAESGAALVEFTLLAPMLLALSIYTMDFGLLFITKMEVQNAAQAGAQYTVVTNGYDATNISNAVTKATNFTAVKATSSQFCGCPSSDAKTVKFCSASCDTCNPGTCSVAVQGRYVTVTATPADAFGNATTYRTLIPFPLVKSTYDVSATSTVRLQ
jgi:Flp pilus assembly protein TadG